MGDPSALRGRGRGKPAQGAIFPSAQRFSKFEPFLQLAHAGARRAVRLGLQALRAVKSARLSHTQRALVPAGFMAKEF